MSIVERNLRRAQAASDQPTGARNKRWRRARGAPALDWIEPCVAELVLLFRPGPRHDTTRLHTRLPITWKSSSETVTTPKAPSAHTHRVRASRVRVRLALVLDWK